MDVPEDSVEAFRRNVRRKLYNIASGDEFHLHDDLPKGHWMQKRIDSTFEIFKKSIMELENNIYLILGPRGSGKTYLLRTLKKRIAEYDFSNARREVKVEVVVLHIYNHPDEVRNGRHLVYALDKLIGGKNNCGNTLSRADVQDRLVHAFRLLKEAGVYVIIVLDGAEALTKGVNDCSVKVGSCKRRQGLLYMLTNMIGSRENCFSLVFITSDIRMLERMEKRVKSRFVHQTIYCHNPDDLDQVFNGDRITLLGPKCEARLDGDAKQAIAEEVACGLNVTTLVGGACAMLPREAFTVSEDGTVSISKKAISEAIVHNKEKTYVAWMLKQLGLLEHHILVAITRLHIKGMSRITLVDIEEDLAEMVRHFPRERKSVPRFQGLLRAFYRLIKLGVLEWVNFEHNYVTQTSEMSNVCDMQGTNASCRFAHYMTYLKMDHSQTLPSHLSLWLSLAIRTMK